jgi:hypothetical protein
MNARIAAAKEKHKAAGLEVIQVVMQEYPIGARVRVKDHRMDITAEVVRHPDTWRDESARTMIGVKNCKTGRQISVNVGSDYTAVEVLP